MDVPRAEVDAHNAAFAKALEDGGYVQERVTLEEAFAGPFIGERRVADVIKGDIERALDAEADGDPRLVADIAAALDIERQDGTIDYASHRVERDVTAAVVAAALEVDGVESVSVSDDEPARQYQIIRSPGIATKMLAELWERKGGPTAEPDDTQHYITTVCAGAQPDGTGRCPKCHLAVGFDNDYDGSVEGVLRREIEGLREIVEQEEQEALNSGGILSDVCDIAFNDEGRAMTAGYDGIRERVRELVELERRLITAAEGESNA